MIVNNLKSFTKFLTNIVTIVSSMITITLKRIIVYNILFRKKLKILVNKNQLNLLNENDVIQSVWKKFLIIKLL